MIGAAARRWVAVAAFAAAVLVPGWRGWAGQVEEERWYVVEMMGQRAGWMRSSVEREGEELTSRSEMRIELKRGKAGVKIGIDAAFVETAAGKPVSMTQTMTLGAMPTTVEVRYGPESMTIIDTQAGQRRERTEPLPGGDWMTPLAAERYVRERLDAGAEEIVVRTIDPGSGTRPVTVTRRVLEKTTVEALGKTVPAIKWSTTTDLVKGLELIEFADEAGEPVRSETSIGGITLVVTLADRDLARAKADPPEIMEMSLVRPEGRVEDARSTRRGSFVLRSTGPGLPEIPALGVQRVERLDDKSARVVVDLGTRPAAPDADARDAAYTSPSRMVGSDDERVRSLVETATGNIDGDDAARAEAMRRFVHGYIEKKTLGVGFATAAEVARTRAGDCSEHATLLAAMLRASGIPARAVSGLVYADHFAGSDAIFGYHMWTQALLEVDGALRWVDLDATLPPATPFDATHIALAVSSLADDDTVNAMVALAPVLGLLEIEVESAE